MGTHGIQGQKVSWYVLYNPAVERFSLLFYHCIDAYYLLLCRVKMVILDSGVILDWKGQRYVVCLLSLPSRTFIMHFTKHKSSSRMKNRNEDNIVRFKSNITQTNKEMLPQYNALKNLTIQSRSQFNYVFSSIKIKHPIQDSSFILWFYWSLFLYIGNARLARTSGSCGWRGPYGQYPKSTVNVCMYVLEMKTKTNCANKQSPHQSNDLTIGLKSLISWVKAITSLVWYFSCLFSSL